MLKTANVDLHRPSLDTYRTLPKIPLVIVLDHIRSLHNVGSIFRTSDAFLVERLCLCGITACPPHREIQKSALGATESVAWRYYEKTGDALDELQAQNYELVALEQAQDAILMEAFEWPAQRGLALILGNEVDGVDPEIMKRIDRCIEIPQYGTKHSLNVSVSAGIAIYQLFQKRSLS